MFRYYDFFKMIKLKNVYCIIDIKFSKVGYSESLDVMQNGLCLHLVLNINQRKTRYISVLKLRKDSE